MAQSGRPHKYEPQAAELRRVISNGNLEGVKTIISELGVDATDQDGRTALINAVIEDKPEIVVWLLESAANVDHQDRVGYTALHFAALNRQTETAKLLLEKGANPNIIDIHGNTPLWTAVFNSREDNTVVKSLLRYNADPDILNKHGRSPRQMFETFYSSGIDDLISD